MYIFFYKIIIFYLCFVFYIFFYFYIFHIFYIFFRKISSKNKCFLRVIEQAQTWARESVHSKIARTSKGFGCFTHNQKMQNKKTLKALTGLQKRWKHGTKPQSKTFYNKISLHTKCIIMWKSKTRKGAKR